MTVLTQWCGNVTDNSASVVYTLDVSGNAQLVTALDSGLSVGVQNGSAVAIASGVVRVEATGLPGNTKIYYGIKIGGVLQPDGRGEFFTMPDKASDFTFAFASCRDGGSTDGGAHVVFDAIRTSGARMFLEIGDFHYGDIGTNDPAAYRAAYNELQGRTRIKALMAAMPVDYVWDDHDIGGNNADRNKASIPAAAAIYRERVPHYPLPSPLAIYHTFAAGPCRFVLLDCRALRSPQADAQVIGKSMLGQAQKAWLKDTLLNATEPVIFIVSSVPWINFVPSEDSWGAYMHERAEFVEFFDRNLLTDRLVFLCGDMHALAADDGTYSPGGIPVFHAAALDQTGSVKGGPYSKGAPAQGAGQYGFVTVTQSSAGVIRVAFRGRNAAGSTLVSLDVDKRPNVPLPQFIRLAGATVPVVAQQASGQAPAARSVRTAA